MRKLNTLFDIAEFVKAHKDDILKNPESFKKTLDLLAKAKKKARSEEDLGEGFSIVDDPNEGFEDDAADQWLKEQGGKDKEEGEESEAAPSAKETSQDSSPKKKYTSEWKPREDYTDKEKAAIDQHMKDGYTHREAERLAGAHKGHMDFRAAMNSGVSPSMMSDKMMEQLKPLAREWLENADRHEKMKADPESNTVKRMSGKMMEAHEQHLGNYNKAYHDFLGSDEVKDKKGRERHQAIQEWKGKWKQENPDFHEGVKQVSEAQRKFGYNQGAAKTTAEQRWDEIVGGKHMPTNMSESEALQHLGGGKSEEGYHGSIIKDPTASFSERHKHILGRLSPEQTERKTHVDTAATTQGVVRRRKGEE